MNKQYKKILEQQHASKELISRTKNAMYEVLENQDNPQKNSKKKNLTFRYLSVAAAFILIVGSAFALKLPNQVHFYEMESEEKMDMRFGTLNPLKREIEGVEFDEIWNIEMNDIESVLELERSESSFYMIQSMVGEVEKGEGSILFKKKDKSLNLVVSFGKSLLPEELRDKRSLTIKGKKVWFTKNKEGDCLTAYSEIDNGSYTLEAENCNQNEFVKAVKEVIEKLQ
ncbi:hypothetical protein [Anaerosacchariphilus polymeriproducens]|uniref:DUF4367 domain-containing protein n=1 Tax=Anaerosacchariphilus polymeriproducens TaxID=1812858 RepID=A0A371AVP7_9FIRM|nr:hypothetical protein [Anaerosacchariphilus polymeriproducens]RDU23611.1 hypothetical protein DWV06_08485 [Anaerosacchariphilus polymeriproducens]